MEGIQEKSFGGAKNPVKNFVSHCQKRSESSGVLDSVPINRMQAVDPKRRKITAHVTGAVPCRIGLESL